MVRSKYLPEELYQLASSLIRALADADAALDPAAVCELAPSHHKNALSRHEGDPRDRRRIDSDQARRDRSGG